jgi:pilus assembly protein CpaB
MKVARLAAVGIALTSGLVVAMLIGGGGDAPPPAPTVVVEQPAEMRGPPTSEILVASTAIRIGGSLSEQNVEWRRWPDEAIGPHFIRRADRPNAREEMRGAITRATLGTGDPINEERIVRADRPSYLAAILPQGMRALSVPIAQETGIGFILPNDRVDVILTRRERVGERENVVSNTILNNIRVLAIDTTLQEGDGSRAVPGRVATLELSPRQAETLAMSRLLGDLSLTLRSLADTDRPTDETDTNVRGGSVTVIRYGVAVQVPVVGR